MRALPSVSVCIPVYRGEQFLAETVRSVLDQTHRDFELVVLDNASPDTTGRIARSFDDSRVRVETNSTTVPQPENWRRAVRLCRTPPIKLLCADDLLRRRRLAPGAAVRHGPRPVDAPAAARRVPRPPRDPRRVPRGAREPVSRQRVGDLRPPEGADRGARGVAAPAGPGLGPGRGSAARPDRAVTAAGALPYVAPCRAPRRPAAPAGRRGARRRPPPHPGVIVHTSWPLV